MPSRCRSPASTSASPASTRHARPSSTAPAATARRSPPAAWPPPASPTSATCSAATARGRHCAEPTVTPLVSAAELRRLLDASRGRPSGSTSAGRSAAPIHVAGASRRSGCAAERPTSIPCRMRIAERSASSSERGRTSLTYLGRTTTAGGREDPLAIEQLDTQRTRSHRTTTSTRGRPSAPGRRWRCSATTCPCASTAGTAARSRRRAATVGNVAAGEPRRRAAVVVEPERARPGPRLRRR